jgi:flagellar motor switch protein FliM
MIEPLMSRISGQSWSDANKARGTDHDRQLIRESLRVVETEVSAVLAETSISMSDFLAINVGDVLLTESETPAPARLFVGGVEKFTARPGMRGRRRALEILAPVESAGA